MSLQVSKPTLVTPPSTEPVTLEEARKQVELGDDPAHDADLILRIQAAREQWEHDTDSYCLSTTLRVTSGYFQDGMKLPGRPIQSISSITYYDANNTQQTLATSVYELDPTRSEVRLAFNQSWPSVAGRWDSVTINYVAGYTDATLVPAVAKQAMLLLIGHYFENKDMMISDALQSFKPYEMLVRRFMRSSYP